MLVNGALATTLADGEKTLIEARSRRRSRVAGRAARSEGSAFRPDARVEDSRARHR